MKTTLNAMDERSRCYLRYSLSFLLLFLLSCGSAKVLWKDKAKSSSAKKTLLLKVVVDKLALKPEAGFVGQVAYAEWLDDENRMSKFEVAAKKIFRKNLGSLKVEADLAASGLKRSDIVTIEGKTPAQQRGFRWESHSGNETQLKLSTENISNAMNSLNVQSITLILVGAQASAWSGHRVSAEVICFDSNGEIARYKEVKNVGGFASYVGKFSDALEEYLAQLK